MRFRLHFAGCVLIALALLLSAPRSVRAQQPIPQHSLGPPVITERTPAAESQSQPIQLSADSSLSFVDRDEDVLLLRGRCELRQGTDRWTSPAMVVWKVPAPSGEQRVLVYLEGNSEQPAEAIGRARKVNRPFFLVDLSTQQNVSLQAPRAPLQQSDAAAATTAVYQRARERRNENQNLVRQVQYQQIESFPGEGMFPVQSFAPRRRVSISPRFLGERLEFSGAASEGTLPREWISTITGGVNIVVDNIPLTINGQTFLSRIDLTADRAVIWTDANYISRPDSFDLDESAQFQIYLEGHIVVRQGANTVSASHAYYDLSQKRGLALNAEVRTLLPDYQGTLRVRAAEVRQYSENHYHARNAWFSTSEFGKPNWRIQASDIFLEERPQAFPFRADSTTGQPANTAMHVTSLNNIAYVQDFPVFALPYLSGSAEEVRIPLRKLDFGYSGMFGAEVRSVWDLDTLFALNLPSGIDWTLEADFMSQRGPGVGTRTEYEMLGNLFGMPVKSEGYGHLYYLHDRGEDNLGQGRRSLEPPDENRGRVLLRNRSQFDANTWLHAEIGHIFNEDRNFMEQFYEGEWDNGKDMENVLALNHQYDNLSASLLGSIRSYDFENQTNWLPRGDLTLLAEPVFGSPVLWSMHSQLGYGQVHQADAPPDPLADPFMPLDYYQDIEGLVSMSRHELTLPFNLGPVHVVPYLLGEVAHWGEDLNGDSLTRWYGSAGVRGSVQFSRYMPEVRSSILGLNGLAHKAVFDFDYYIADSSADLSRVPQYNEFDDNAQERFRSRFLPIEFGGVLPPMFNPRNYAVRSGAGRSVTAPYHELVDEQHVLWLGMRNRWQTKVGPPEMPRIIDWMELDLGLGIFPNADRDNFGETLGLLTGRYAWHVGPRTSLLADGVFDVFDDGQRVWNVGVLSQRSARGSVYLGYRDVQAGPVDSKLITASMSYVMSPNLYVMTAGASFDIAEGVDRGESVTITRIGEYYLLHAGFGYDRSRNNVGVALSIEPKFGSYGSNSMQLNSLLGIP